jgi:tight adherence protein C
MIPLIMITTFSSILLFIIGITMKTERDMIRDRVERFSTSGESIGAPLHPEFQASFGDRVLRPFLRQLAVLGLKFTPSGATSAIEKKMETAGHPMKMGVKEFVGAKVLCIGVFVILAYWAYSYMRANKPEYALVSGILILVVGVLLPDYVLQKVIEARQSKIRRALPDTIDLLTVSVEAGVGFDGAMARVSEKMKGPFTEELVRALEEMRLGKSRMQALRDMGARVAMIEVTTFVAALYQAEQLGVSISKVLRVQGDTMRVRRSQMARELASKLPVKMLFPLVIFIFPALFVVTLGPAVIQIYRVFQ